MAIFWMRVQRIHAQFSQHCVYAPSGSSPCFRKCFTCPFFTFKLILQIFHSTTIFELKWEEKILCGHFNCYGCVWWFVCSFSFFFFLHRSSSCRFSLESNHDFFFVCVGNFSALLFPWLWEYFGSCWWRSKSEPLLRIELRTICISHQRESIQTGLNVIGWFRDLYQCEF